MFLGERSTEGRHAHPEMATRRSLTSQLRERHRAWSPVEDAGRIMCHYCLIYDVEATEPDVGSSSCREFWGHPLKYCSGASHPPRHRPVA